MPNQVNPGAVGETAETALRKFFSPTLRGPNWDALMGGIATGIQYVWDLAPLAFDQLFSSSASGVFLDQRGADIGLRRPYGVGMGDPLYRKLIAHAGTDQITVASLLETMEIFYGEDSTRAYCLSGAVEPYVLESGDDLVILINRVDEIRVVFVDNDFRAIGSATAAEVAAVITRVLNQFYSGAIALARTDPETDQTGVIIYTSALGLKGSISIWGGKAQTVLQFPTAIATAQVNGTVFQVKAGSRLGRIRFEWIGGTNPELYRVHIGDYAMVYGSSFDDANRGSYEILDCNNSWIEVDSWVYSPEIVTITAADEIQFYRPTEHTIFNSLHAAYVFEPTTTLVEAVMPAISQVVNRVPTKAAYCNVDLPISIIGFSRDGGTGIVTMETGVAHGLSESDWVIIDSVAAGVPPVQNKVIQTADLFTARHSIGLSLMNDGREALATGGKDNGVYLDTCELYRFVDTDYVSVNDWIDGYGVANMGLARCNHKQITLADGNILVIGGEIAGPSSTETCELYLVEQNQWQPVGNMSVARLGHQAVTLQDGRILVCGGDMAEAVANVEIYDPATMVWTLGAAMSTPRRNHTAVLLQDGRVFIAGGQIGGAALDTCEIYNPWTNEFTPPAAIPVMPGVRSNLSACFVPSVGISGKVFVCGGTDNPAAPAGTDTAWYYDPVGNAWEVLPVLEQVRWNHSLTYLRDKTVLVVGGAAAAPSVEVFEPLNGTWGGNYAGEDIVTLFDKHAVIETNVLGFATLAEANHDRVRDEARVVDRDVLITGLASLDDFGMLESWYWSSHRIVRAGGINGEFKVLSIVSPTVFTYQSTDWQDTGTTVNGSWPANKIVCEGVLTKVAAVTNKNVQGPYIYDPDAGLSVTGFTGVTVDELFKNNGYGSIAVSGVGLIPDGVGYLVFAFGSENQVGPVPYYARPNSTTLVLDRSFIFDKTVPPGSTVTYLLSRSAWVPEAPEDFGGLYLTASPAGRVSAESRIDETIAAGVALNKVIVYPGDRGLGGEGLPVEGEAKLSDVVSIWAGDDISETVARARESGLT